MRVALIGGGLGGLTAALSLHAAGIEVDVYEAAAEIGPLGVGINLLPHAAREMLELGLAEELSASGVATSALAYVNVFGQEIWREPRGLAAGYHWPQYSIHRGRLQTLLLEAAVARLGADRIHLDHELVRFETGDHDATGHFRSRLTGEAHDPVTADLLVACDGIHSAARSQLHPDEGAPLWNRRVLWRGVTEGDVYLDGRTMIMAGHQDLKFVCYPIDPAPAVEGRSLINWIAEVRYPEDYVWRREDWNRRGDISEFLPQFESWDFGWLNVPQIIRGAAEVFEYPVVDRNPLERWTYGRLTLLGDAAHPMYPIGSNGASQAILDARTLAFELAAAGGIDAAVARYENARRPATTKIVLSNRGNGPEAVMQMVHERAPTGFVSVDDVVSPQERQSIADNYKRIAGFDLQALNSRPSLTVRVPQTA
jgi:2-polyprenyl-6-methoxyphenol hydroxylase-like FAD-dependent oxidoreductase